MFRKWFLSVLGAVCAGMSMSGLFWSLFANVQCPFTHAARRLCHGKPRSLGCVALVSDVHGSRKSSFAKGETQIAEDPSWTGDVIAQEDLNSPRSRFSWSLLVIGGHGGDWRGDGALLLHGREGNSSCYANRGSLASLKLTPHGLLGFCIASPFQSERLWCHCRVLRTLRRCIERLERSRFAPTFSSSVEDAATQPSSPLQNILQTHAPKRSRVGLWRVLIFSQFEQQVAEHTVTS